MYAIGDSSSWRQVGGPRPRCAAGATRMMALESSPAAPRSMPSFRFLQTERDDAIAIVTLDRPPVNAVNQEMYAEIRDLFAIRCG
jgi:hypothetical protein